MIGAEEAIETNQMYSADRHVHEKAGDWEASEIASA